MPCSGCTVLPVVSSMPCPVCTAQPVLSCLYCLPVLSCLNYFACSVQTALLWLSYSNFLFWQHFPGCHLLANTPWTLHFWVSSLMCPVLAVLSRQFCLGKSVLAVLSWQSCPGQAILSWQSCPPDLFCLLCSACHALTVLFYLSCSTLLVMLFLSYSACPVLPVLF
jgi:hypothetical protein